MAALSPGWMTEDEREKRTERGSDAWVRLKRERERDG